ncbi:unnamed protein product [Sphagnum balticum]
MRVMRNRPHQARKKNALTGMEPRKTSVETEPRLMTTPSSRTAPAAPGSLQRQRKTLNAERQHQCLRHRESHTLLQGFAKTKQRSGKPRSVSPTKNHWSSQLVPQQREARTTSSLL